MLFPDQNIYAHWILSDTHRWLIFGVLEFFYVAKKNFEHVNALEFPRDMILRSTKHLQMFL
jgi:hypothetical protein